MAMWEQVHHLYIVVEPGVFFVPYIILNVSTHSIFNGILVLSWQV